MNLWFLDNPAVSGVFNTGTGKSQSFNDVANAVIDWHGHGRIRYIPFPAHLEGAYQSYTQADLTDLREAGCDVEARQWIDRGPSAMDAAVDAGVLVAG